MLRAISHLTSYFNLMLMLSEREKIESVKNKQASGSVVEHEISPKLHEHILGGGPHEDRRFECELFAHDHSRCQEVNPGYVMTLDTMKLILGPLSDPSHSEQGFSLIMTQPEPTDIIFMIQGPWFCLLCCATPHIQRPNHLSATRC
jgi:hypothetical protein